MADVKLSINLKNDIMKIRLLIKKFQISVILVFLSFVSCNKEENKQNMPINNIDEDVPFFEVAKGDSISKNIFRAKPIFNQSDEMTLLYSSYDEKKSKASGSSYEGVFCEITRLAVHICSSAHQGGTWDDGYGHVYNLIPVDLNEGSGGKYIYLVYSKDPNIEGARGYYNIHINIGLSQNLQPGEWVTGDPALGIMADLNDGAGGSYLYLHSFDNGNYFDHAIDVAIVSSTSSNVGYSGPGGPWYKVNTDLNYRAGGKYIYLFYSRSPLSK